MIRRSKKKSFTKVSNTIVNDERLSLKAKGLMVYLLSKPDTWKFYQETIVKDTSDGVKAVRSAIKELEENGYLVRKRTRDEKGGFAKLEWIVIEEPLQEEKEKEVVVEDLGVYRAIMDYFNARLGVNYKHTSKSIQRLIDARIAEGNTLEDFKRVINLKKDEWSGNEKMEKFLRPETLFGDKFETYKQGGNGGSTRTATREELDNKYGIIL